MTAQQPKTANINDIEDLDSVLSGLDTSVSSDTATEELIEEVDQLLNSGEGQVIEEGIDDLNLADDEKAIRQEEARAERQKAYANQESTVDATTTPKNKKKEASAPKTAKPKKEKEGDGSSAPRIVRDLASLPASVFVLEGSTQLPAEALEKAKADTIALMPDQKKVKEKFENLFASLHAGRLPSTFIVQAFLLLDNGGSTSSTDIVAAFKTKGAKNANEGYNEGTARSQTGQIMSLFEAVKIASRHKQALQLNKNSNVAALLRKVIEDNSKTSA